MQRNVSLFSDDLSTVFKYTKQFKLKIIILLKNYTLSWKKCFERKIFLWVPGKGSWSYVASCCGDKVKEWSGLIIYLSI